ncbi:MAG: ADOP family duplicated permease [Acidobacteriota bacterium]
MFARLLSELRYRWRALVARDRMEDELEDELAFHLEQEQKKLEARGMPPDAARRAARLAFGGYEAIREATRDARGVRLVEQTWTDVVHALRTLRTRPAFALGVVGTLALGLGANAAMFGIVDRLMFRTPAGLRDADRVHRVHQHWRQNGEMQSSRSMAFPRYRDVARDARSFDLVGAFQVRRVALGQGDDTREGRVAVVSAGYLDFFDAPPALGRWFTAGEDEPPLGAPVAVLSDAYWRVRYGARPDVLGETIQVDRLQATIIGVAPPGFAGINDDGAPLVFVPMSAFAHALRGSGYDTSYNWSWLQILVRRAPGVSVAEANAELTRVLQASWQAEAERHSRSEPVDLAAIGGTLGPVLLGRGPDASRDARVAFWISGVALIVLLIACANVANLFLSRAVSRQREVAMRLALGVGRGRLTRQLLMESLVLGVAGGAGGLLLAWLGGGALRALLLPDADAAAVLTDARTLVYALALAIAAGTLTAVVPAMMAARIDVAGALKSGGRGATRRRSRLQAALVVVQAALSVVLLVGAALFVGSLQRAEAHRLGYDVERLLVAGVNLRGERLDDDAQRQLVTRMLEAAVRVPGVTHATMAASVPFWSTEARGFHVDGVDDVERLGRFAMQAGTGDYFAATGTRILRGRPFTDADREGAPLVIVVSEGMARALWPGQDAIGKCVRLSTPDAPCRTVIGIAEEAALMWFDAPRRYAYYLPVAQYPDGLSTEMLLRVASDTGAAVAAVRAGLQAALPGAAYATVMPLQDLVAPELLGWRLGATMFVAFGVLALAVAALGLHSVVSYEVAQRGQEFGVRMALGATRGRILWLVVGRGARLAALGVAIGVGLAVAGSGEIEALLFHQSPRDPAVIAGVALALLGIATLASAVPAMGATRVEPGMALRAD